MASLVVYLLRYEQKHWKYVSKNDKTVLHWRYFDSSASNNYKSCNVDTTMEKSRSAQQPEKTQKNRWWKVCVCVCVFVVLSNINVGSLF